MSSAGRHRWLAAVALSTVAFDLIVFVVLHIVQPEVDVLREPTSAYVHGTLGFASALASAAVGIGGVALAAASWRVARATPARIGAGLLALFGVAKLAQAFFPIDPPGQSTPTGTAHNLLGNLAFFALPVAALLVTRAVAVAAGRGSPAWRPVAVAWVLVVTTAGVLAGDGLGFFGLAQRIYLVSAMGWTALVAAWLWHPGPGAEPAPDRPA